MSGPAWVALQALGFLTLPALGMTLARRYPAGAWLSPVVVLFALGVLTGNLGLPLDKELAEGVATAGVLLGIPLLIFPADFLGWLRLARSTALACAVSFGSVAVVTLLSAWVFAPRTHEGWIVAGMLTGTYTGSAPNLVAVAKGLGASPETLVLVTTADLIAAGLFAFVLLSPAVRWLEGWLLPFPVKGEGGEVGRNLDAESPTLLGGAASLSLATVVVAVGGGLGLLVSPSAQQLVAILAVTTLGTALSFSPRIRRLPASALLGEYFILVFCVGFGTLADFRRLLDSEASGLILGWTCAVMLGGVSLHLLLCRLLKIDRDTALITTTAAIYGPPMIGPVATNLRNPELVLSGLTAALVGLAAGNYLGVAVAWIVKSLSG